MQQDGSIRQLGAGIMRSVAVALIIALVGIFLVSGNAMARKFKDKVKLQLFLIF